MVGNFTSHPETLLTRATNESKKVSGVVAGFLAVRVGIH